MPGDRDSELGAIEERLQQISRERDVLNEEASSLIVRRRQLEWGVVTPTATATIISPEPIESAEEVLGF